MIGECEHGYQRWHCETCKLRAVADRLAEAIARIKVADWWYATPDTLNDALSAALDEYRKAVSDGN
jgi:hypothetical protein